MPGVGNDVVDLKDPENIEKSRNDRFLGRVFTAGEREWIASAPSPDTLLWSLWAAKEAAYKAVSRGDPAVCSIPRQYQVVLDAEDTTRKPVRRTGKVITPQGKLVLEVAVSADLVHALAAGAEETLRRLCRRVKRLDGGKSAGDPSVFVRGALLREIARRLNCPVTDLSIVKNQDGLGAPRVIFRGDLLAAEVSLSHDGRFAAFAFDPATLIPIDCTG
ncbi:MAG: 4'-phosphopantetheinyl transferase superfamily protein [Proteobacteria bacterium]|nr:4'-phosphopantetheinyl transferase superfamily protein [Pseudomonadota bacterium]MCG2741765.1 4'-phosphopantetheinyl transferase superfamily protein [Syntrophaceae bacterium]